jgi:hypothetical protein
MILVETCVLSPVGPSLARPKSESLALKCETRRMFDVFEITIYYLLFFPV